MSYTWISDRTHTDNKIYLNIHLFRDEIHIYLSMLWYHSAVFSFMPRLFMNTLPSLELFVNTKHVIPSQHLIDAVTCGWGSKVCHMRASLNKELQRSVRITLQVIITECTKMCQTAPNLLSHSSKTFKESCG